ncbi:unnamed protein product [Cyclocybe aegerita]|uniref:Uncharacterized protein n=1 Tax=Cyclocybe aegerita TaxID=1973307 RepID=A0A8S0WMH7_CYCAE|nr:unnamed protein product [Cyclocybe aegerita]
MESLLKNLHIGEHKSEQDHAATPPPTAAVTQTQAKKDESIFDKLGDVLSGRKTPPPPPAPVVQPKKEESVFDKIGDALSGRKTPPPPVAQPQKSDSVFDKIGDALSGRKTPPPAPPKKDNLLDKIGDVLGGKKEEPAKPQGLMDKLNHHLGGGAKGEAEEGKLDKAIDLFQEHVLKEGPQHNESALEQAKDKKIADTIRNTLGLEKKK